MIVWIGLFVFIVGVKLAMGELNTDKKKKRFLRIVGIVLALFWALRGENYGRVYDLRVYMATFEEIAITPWDQLFYDPTFEPGFTVLNKLLSYLSTSGRTIIVFHAIFCVYTVCRFIYKNTNEVFWGFLFFYSLGNMGFFLTGLRQAIAMCVCMYAVEAAKKKKLILFVLLNLLAMTVHISALIFAAVYFLINMGIFRQNKWLIILPIVLLVAFSSQLVGLSRNISEELVFSETAKFTFNGIVPILIYAITILLQILFAKKQKLLDETLLPEERKDTYVGFAMTAVGLGLYFLRFYARSLERLAFFYLQGSPIALADVTTHFKRSRDARLIELVLVVLSFILFVHRLSDASYADYIFFWETQL